jgi:hypothetical protein
MQPETAPQVINGVDVSKLHGTIEAIKQTPSLATFRFRIENRSQGGDVIPTGTSPHLLRGQ